MKRNSAPQWFYVDKKNRVPEEEIREKIHIEVCNEVINGRFDRRIWTEEFTQRVSDLYYRFFNQLYMQGA